MQVDFSFGKSGLSLRLPSGVDYRLLEARTASPLVDWRASLERALDEPISGKSLAALAAGKRSAAISVCDITWPAPNRLVLPSVLSRLEAAGIPRAGITILIATGLHRPATEDEIREIVGPEIAAAYRVKNHFARNLSEHRQLGQTKSGTPVYIDERFVSAGVRVTLGFIEPHLMLGYSGGRKLVAPGLAAQETIKVLHSPKFMRDARTHEGSIADNPLHRELLEIAGMAGHQFMVDVALTRKREIAGVFAGEPAAAHGAGVEFVSHVMLERLEEPVDAVITTAAGYPLDLTFYQAVKGLTAAQHIVKPGGRILLMASCDEGPGAQEFRTMLKTASGAAEFLDAIASTPVVVDQWQLEKFAMVTERADLYFYVPGLPAEYYPSLWGRAYESGRSGGGGGSGWPARGGPGGGDSRGALCAGEGGRGGDGMRLVVLMLAFAALAPAQKWQPLFNGKDLTGWESRGDGIWTVMSDGTLLGQRGPLGKPPVNDVTAPAYNAWYHAQAWLYTKAEYDQYDLALEYWLPVGGNSGIALRDPSRAEAGIKVPPDFTKTPAKSAYEIQLNNGYPGDTNYSGSIYNLAKAPLGLQIAHDWNKIEIQVRKDKIRVMLNGKLAAEHPGDPKRALVGPIGLQLHDRVTVAMFRNVRIRVIK